MPTCRSGKDDDQVGHEIMLKKGILAGLAVVLASQAMPHAQEQRQPSERRRERVQMMEGVLSRAVRSGAEGIAGRMKGGNPNVNFFTGQARARGFILEGYGVFFDVEIPALIESVVWSMQVMERDLVMASALESLRLALADVPESTAKLRAQQALKQMQQFAPAPSLTPPQGMPRTTGAVAATENAPAPVNASRSTPLAAAPFDPQAAYTESVQRELIDAMLDYSHPIDIQPDEWLTVAARGSEGPLRPGEIYDPVTIVIRVKGSDLAAYYADRSKGDEIRKRVEVRVF
jgi:hypothetical protein